MQSLSEEKFWALMKTFTDGSDQRFIEKWFSAAQNGDTSTINDMIKNMYIDLQDHDGMTALIWAAQFGHINVMELLIKNGASINKNARGYAPALYIAILHKQESAVQFLLNNGAEINVLCGFLIYMTPLSYATKEEHLAVVKMLLDKNADVNIQDFRNDTALMWAARVGNKEIAEMILQKKPNTGLKNNGGETALDIAIKKGHREIQELIEKHSNRWLFGIL